MTKIDSHFGYDFRTFRGHMENHTKNGPKSRFKKWDAKPFLRIIHDVISIFRLHFPQKAEMNGLPPGPGINTKLPICTLQNDTLSVNPTLPKKRGRTEKLRRKSVV